MKPVPTGPLSLRHHVEGWFPELEGRGEFSSGIGATANVSWSGGYSSALLPGNSVKLSADGGPTGNYWAATAGAHTLTALADDVNRFPDSHVRAAPADVAAHRGLDLLIGRLAIDGCSRPPWKLSWKWSRPASTSCARRDSLSGMPELIMLT